MIKLKRPYSFCDICPCFSPKVTNPVAIHSDKGTTFIGDTVVECARSDMCFEFVEFIKRQLREENEQK